MKKIRQLVLLATPLLALIIIELALRAGVLDRFARHDSHLGNSIQLKRALSDPTMERIDFVTLGNSRPLFGIDHARLADDAARYGLVHANLSTPGAHWMTMDVLLQWLGRKHPEIKGGIIALSIQDFAFPENGTYELAIVEPFRMRDDEERITAHITADSAQIETWSIHAALFAWREDVRDLLRNPRPHLGAIRRSLEPAQTTILSKNQAPSKNVCMPQFELSIDCDAIEEDGGRGLRRQCAQARLEIEGRQDYRLRAPTSNLSVEMQRTRQKAQSQLRGIHWQIPPLVILMPMPRLWRTGVKAEALHEWALDILRPLVESGTIQIIDATDYFDELKDKECNFFSDYYHQSSRGRDSLHQWLAPQIDRALQRAPSNTEH